MRLIARRDQYTNALSNANATVIVEMPMIVFVVIGVLWYGKSSEMLLHSRGFCLDALCADGAVGGEG